MKEKRDSLLYHSLHGRSSGSRGCLPLCFLLSAALAVPVLMLVRVDMPQPSLPAGEGNVFYRSDDLTASQLIQRSPLPLRLPRYADPARRLDDSVELPLRREPAPAAAPAESPFSPAPDSVVLREDVLLALPPAKETKAEGGGENGTSPEPPAEPEGEPSAEPVGEEPAP